MNAHVSMNVRVRAWEKAIRYAWRQAFRIDRSQLVITRPMISTFGFVLPLALGVITGHLVEGVSIAGGAASLGGVGLTFTRQARIRTLLIASVGIAISAFVGALVGPIPWLSIVLIGIWGLMTGMLVVINQSVTLIGIQATIALIILTHFTLSPVQALFQALLMLTGAVFQTLLSFLPSWQYVGSERAALATVYQALADYAEDPTSTTRARSINDALTRAEEVLSENRSRNKQVRTFRNLFDEAERIRLEITLLSDTLQQVMQNAPDQEQEFMQQQGQQLINSIMATLQKIADKIDHDQPMNDLPALYKEMDAAEQHLAQRDSIRRSTGMLQRFPLHYKALRSHLRAAEKLAGSQLRRRRTISFHLSTPHPPRLRLHNPIAIFRANLTLRSTAFRHAIRLAMVLVIAAILYRFTPLQRGYWIPITALLVLRPDFTTTFTRGIMRLVGTTLGAASVALFLGLVTPSNSVLVVAEVIVTFAAFSLISVNYGIFSFFITAQVILLLFFVDHRSTELEFYRTLDTVIGGVLSLLAYVVWPTWERQQVPEQLARRVDSLRRYYVEIMQAYIHPDDYDVHVVRQRRQEARLARTNTEASVGRALNEPQQYRLDRNLLQSLIVETDQLAKAMISLEAYLIDNPSHTPLPMLVPFLEIVNNALRSLVSRLRNKPAKTAWPDLQAAVHDLEKTRKELREQDRQAYVELSFVLFASKRIIERIEALNQSLSS